MKLDYFKSSIEKYFTFTEKEVKGPINYTILSVQSKEIKSLYRDFYFLNGNIIGKIDLEKKIEEAKYYWYQEKHYYDSLV